jgi:F5/8 type C domain-containing protein
MRRWLLLLLFLPRVAWGADARVIDAFENAAQWSAHPADGVKLALASDAGMKGRSLRLDFDFTGGGYAVVHRDIDLNLPENYAFSFRVRGQSPPNSLEFKLIDSTGANVWWNVHRDVTFSDTWQTFTIKKRQIQFAWGPQGGGEITHVAAIEFSVTAGQGGKGSVWLDELELRPLPPPGATPPQPRARASSGAHPERVLDGSMSTVWRSVASDKQPWIALDFRELREYGGLVVDWEDYVPSAGYSVDTSVDGNRWTTVRTVTGSNGGRDYLFLPESESRFLRLSLSEAAGPMRIRELTVKPLAWSETRESFFGDIGKDAPRGTYPRGMLGEPAFWTVVGADANPTEGLLSQDGALEAGKRGFTVEPFLYLFDDRPLPARTDHFITWADVQSEQSLERGCLPIPSLTWKHGDIRLAITVLAGESLGSSWLLSRYRLENSSSDSLRAVLCLTIRPFQANPPSQGLNTPGGCASVRSIEYSRDEVRINESQIVRPLIPPYTFGATSFDGGDVVADYVSRGGIPPVKRVVDSFEAASGVMGFVVALGRGAYKDIDVLVSLNGTPPDSISFDREFEFSRRYWDEKTGAVSIQLPKSAHHAVDSFRSQIGYILVNRAGPAIQPGSRSYARSWIRDGSLTSSALLRAGRPEVVREFIEWYAPHQYPNGKAPCVVDSRGSDPVPEHDSTGEFLFLLAEYYRFTKDRDLVGRHWLGITHAVAYLDSLRHERLTDTYRTPENAKFFGILPPSISHEGYSAKPMHSYWDDFFALRGFKDAAFLAQELGHAEEAERFSAIRDAFAKDLAASIAAAMKDHKIDYVPGCADLGDFDATSTTIALSPAQASFLPQAAVLATFERYYKFFEDRKTGAPWEAFTPYEIRNIGAFVRLGWRDRAQELMQYFLEHQSPPGWNQWAEVVWHDTTTAHFIGDLPHTWVGSDYMRSFLDCFAYDREDDQSLVLAAGIPANWVREEDGVAIKDLRTQYGLLSYRLVEKKDVLEMRIDKTLQIPPGGLVLRPPLPSKAPRITVNGKPVPLSPEGEVVVRHLPAVVRWRS